MTSQTPQEPKSDDPTAAAGVRYIVSNRLMAAINDVDEFLDARTDMAADTVASAHVLVGIVRYYVKNWRP